MRIDSTESVIDETARIHHNDELFDGEVETKDASGVAVGEWRKWHPNGRLAEWRSLSGQGQQLARKRWDEDGNQTQDKTFAQ